MLLQQERIDELVGRLKESGCRITPQRMAILDILFSSPDHPTADQVYEQVRQDFPMTSLATVYKTINLLKDMGELLELDINDSGKHYDGSNPHPHPHLVCTQCNAIIDLEDYTLEETMQEAQNQHGYQILSHRMVIFGVCPECQE